MSKNEHFSLKELEKDLKPSIGDHIHNLIKIILSSVPEIGGPATELFNTFITPPLEKRRDEWIKIIALELSNLIEEYDLDVDALINNESFFTTLMHASQLAILNHQKEKHEALKNAVLNSALPNSFEDDLKLIFLNYIDSFTVLHLKLLEFLNTQNSTELFNKLKHNVHYLEDINDDKDDLINEEIYAFEFWDVIHFIFLNSKSNKFLYVKIIKDLISNGLIVGEWPIEKFIVYIKNNSTTPNLTYLGEEFMKFIKSP